MLNKNMKNKKKNLSVKELADILKISRVAVFNKIKNGQIYAEKVGRNYVIPKDRLGGIIACELTDKLKEEIENGVDKVIGEYGDVLRKLGKE